MADEFKATVLVVDDEVLIRMDLVDMLTAAGYRTREAGCATDAIAILEADATIRVVFTDIQMPGSMDGLALSHFVRERWPPTIIVISSGNRSPGLADLPSDAHFISKPFGPTELDALLHEVGVKLAAT